MLIGPIKKFAGKPISKRVVANLLATTACGTGAIGQAGLVAAVEQAANGIVITDVRGKIEYVNPAFTAMTGYSSQEAVGQYPRILKSGCQPQSLYDDLWKTVSAARTERSIQRR
jgi:PAS domain-containing protein